MIDFDAKHRWFRDEAQRDRVRDVVHRRLADDRAEEECRYLMRFWWHLAMSYRETSHAELQEHVSGAKWLALDRLFGAIEIGYEAVDAWIERCEAELPVIEDRGDPETDKSTLGDPLVMLRAAIQLGQKVQIRRAGVQPDLWNGFPLAIGEELVLVRSLDDFHLDGFAVLRLEDITAVRSGEPERFFERVLCAEGLLQNAPPPPSLDLSSWQHVVEAVRREFRFAILECEREDDPGFYLGEIVRVDADAAWVRCIQVDGVKDEEECEVPLEDLTLLRFDERYLTLFGRYSVDLALQ